MKKTAKKILSGVVALGMVASLLPGMSFTALAATNNASVAGEAFKSGQTIALDNSTPGSLTNSDISTALADNYDLPKSGTANVSLSYSSTAVDPAATLSGTVDTSGELTIDISQNNAVNTDAGNNTTFTAATLVLTSGSGFVELQKVEDKTEASTSPGLDALSTTNAQVNANKTDGGTGEFWTNGKYSVADGGDFEFTITAETGYEIGPDTKVEYSIDGAAQNAAVTKTSPTTATFTISGITGDTEVLRVIGLVQKIEITSNPTGEHARTKLTITGPNDVLSDANGAAQAPDVSEANKDVTFTWTTPDNVLIRSITYQVGNSAPKPVEDVTAGSYTIKANEVTDDIEIKATTVDGVKIDIAAGGDPNGVKKVTIDGKDYTLPASVIVESGSNPSIEVVLDEAYELTDDNLEVVNDETSGEFAGRGLTVAAASHVTQGGTLTIGGWQRLNEEDLATINFSSKNAKILDPDTGKEVPATKKVPKGSEYTVMVELEDGAENLSVFQDGEQIGSGEGRYSINVPANQRMPIEFKATAKKDTPSGSDDSGSEDGKTDDGKTDDGKTDDGKTDDGKTDDGKTDDGAVTTDFADDADIADYAKPYVKAAADAGIVKGKENNRFDPKGGATRAEFATMIQRALGLKSDKTESRFSDVKAPLNEDLINGVLACEDIDPFIVEGYPDGTFQPGKQISRAEGILMIWRAVGRPAYTGADKFTDLQSWYATAANWAADQGIALGDGQGHFNGGALLTREDLATLLGRAIEKGIIKLPTAAAADDKADDAKTDESKTDETKTEDGASDETKTDGSAAEGSSTEETKTEDTAA